VERRGRVIRVSITLVNWQREEPTNRGEGRQPLLDGTSRVSREAQARFCEGLGVQLPGATRPPIESRTPAMSCGVKGGGTSGEAKETYHSR
jgi:hypothetical protein